MQRYQARYRCGTGPSSGVLIRARFRAERESRKETGAPSLAAVARCRAISIPWSRAIDRTARRKILHVGADRRTVVVAMMRSPPAWPASYRSIAGTGRSWTVGNGAGSRAADAAGAAGTGVLGGDRELCAGVNIDLALDDKVAENANSVGTQRDGYCHGTAHMERIIGNAEAKVTANLLRTPPRAKQLGDRAAELRWCRPGVDGDVQDARWFAWKTTPTSTP